MNWNVLNVSVRGLLSLICPFWTLLELIQVSLLRLFFSLKAFYLVLMFYLRVLWHIKFIATCTHFLLMQVSLVSFFHIVSLWGASVAFVFFLSILPLRTLCRIIVTGMIVMMENGRVVWIKTVSYEFGLFLSQFFICALGFLPRPVLGCVGLSMAVVGGRLIVQCLISAQHCSRCSSKEG